MEKNIGQMKIRDFLVATNHIRMEEEMVRPRVEVWPDPWIEWVDSHRRRKAGLPPADPCDVVDERATPLCGLGSH